MNNIDIVNEEFERETTTLIVRSCLFKALNTLQIIKQEEEILQFINNMKSQGITPEPPKPDPNRKPNPPIVITSTNRKQEIKVNAFKPGWNLPTMTIEEAGEIDYQDMLRREKQSAKLKEESLVKEYQNPEEDENEVYKKREWDEWLEENPKGSGNTGTKGYYY